MSRIAAAVEKLPKAEAPDGGCDPPKDDRRSDLCAQWKAADAAAESADWTARTFWAGLVGLAIGLGTLVFAARAAHWAKRAAEETEKSAIAADKAVIEAKRLGEAQVRCYLTSPSCEIGFTRDGTAVVKCQVKNVGQSPARHVQIKGEVSYCSGGGYVTRKEPAGKYDLLTVDVGPGGEEEVAFGVIAHADKVEREEIGSYFHITVKATISAEDVFDEKVVIVERFAAFLSEQPECNAWITMKRSGHLRQT